MLKLISNEAAARLKSFPVGKKVAFLILLFERMIPSLRSFCLAESRDFRPYQKAREEFWRSLIDGSQPISWVGLREDILDATPDSEDFGSLEATFALDAALVAADIAGLLGDRQESHVYEAMIYARNSLGAYVRNDMGMVSGDSTIRHVMDAHPLVHKEKQREEEDIEFLSTMLDSPWFEDVFSLLQRRAEAQGGLFDKI